MKDKTKGLAIDVQYPHNMSRNRYQYQSTKNIPSTISQAKYLEQYAEQKEKYPKLGPL